MKFPTVVIGLVGSGTIGSGLIRLVRQKVSQRYGVNVRLKRIVDVNSRIRKFPGILYSRKYEDLLADPEITIIVELICGSGERGP